MAIKYHNDLIQGTEEWFAARCGLLTASEMKLIITPAKLQYASNDKERAHLYALLAQRITKYTEPSYINDDMLRGLDDEIDAKNHYEKHYAKVQDVGFITNDKWGFTLGFSPDAVVGEDGLIEIKGRRQKYQVETILSGKMPDDYSIQVQTGLLVSERKWCDFISYSGGMPMFVLRVEANKEVQDAIIAAATTFHTKLSTAEANYGAWLVGQGEKLIKTERRVEQEMHL